MGQHVDRRSFVVGMGLSGVAAAGALAGCSFAGGASKATTGEDEAWDREADIVVVGSGTGLFGALMAAHEGARVLVLEKGPSPGGTTALSGNGCWVPRNRHMQEHGIQELSDDQIVDYIDACDVFKTAPRALKKNYVARASKVFDYIEDEFGLRLDTNYHDPKFDGKVVRGDYYPLPGNMTLGRSLFFCDEEGSFYFSKNYAKSIIPYAESLGIEVLLNTQATSLVLEGKTVVGVEAIEGSKPLRVKAEKGVVLAAGGFDYNSDMIRAYLRGPLYGSNAVPQNTGDAHIMGMAVGAALGNMPSAWGVPFFKNSKEGYSTVYDWSTWRTKPYSMIVNKRGRRFASESSAYSIINLAFNAYDAGTCGYLNLPAYFICDAKYVETYGYPGAKKDKEKAQEQPEFVLSFQSLADLADACGIDSSALADEVARFNSFAVAGIDEDWKRGEYFHEYRTNGDLTAAEKGLPNACMGPIEAPPFYVAEIGPGTCGTNGGLVVDEESRVLRPDGSAIERLYAAGNTAASIFGSGYPGAGGTVAPGIFQAMVGVNHALGLEKF